MLGDITIGLSIASVSITRNCYDRCRVLLLGTIIVLILTCISIVSYSGAYSAMRFHISVQNIGEILDAFDV